MTIENPLLAHSDGQDVAVVDMCACGCGEPIYDGYKALCYEGTWFYNTRCLARWMGAEWRVAE